MSALQVSRLITSVALGSVAYMKAFMQSGIKVYSEVINRIWELRIDLKTCFPNVKNLRNATASSFQADFFICSTGFPIVKEDRLVL